MAVTKEQVVDALARVAAPDGRPLTQAGALSEIVATDGKVFFSINVDRQAAKKDNIPLPDPTTISGSANDADWDVKATLFGDLAVSAP